MKKNVWLTVAMGIGLVGHLAYAQESGLSEQERQRLRTEALERKVEMLERNQRETLGSSEEQINRVVERLAKQREKPTDFTTSWKDGLVFETRDKQFKIHFGGRLHYDAAWLAEDHDTHNYKAPAMKSALGDQADGTELRRLRLQADGLIYGDAFYKLEVDFVGAEKDKDGKTYGTSTVVLKDAYIGLKDVLPFVTVQAGHFKEPFSLEELTSDNFVTFMERALPNIFAPSYNAGVMAYNSVLKDRATWAVGVFRDTDDRGFSQTEGGYNVTARVTGLPWYEDNGEKLLHLGASASYRCPQTTVQYAQRPEMHLASKYLDTGAIASQQLFLYGTEAAVVYGPFSVQGEFIGSMVDRKKATDVNFYGGYAQASYFLTGEHRGYKPSAGVFDRVRPAKNLGKDKDGHWNPGAWELAARYSYLNVDHRNVRGGRLQDVTLGVNWYWNPNVRFTANYIRAILDDNGAAAGGSTDSVGMRIQVDF